MRRDLLVCAVAVCLTPGSASAQEPALSSTLHCYETASQIGVVARRDFADANGLVSKEILYVGDWPVRPCTDEKLRVHSIRTFQRDALGRVFVEMDLRPDGTVDRTWRLEYLGEQKEPIRRVQYDPAGHRRYEVRSAGNDQTDLHFDGQGRVVAVRGSVPTDVEMGFEWGPSLDGWRCGIAVSDRSARVLYLHLRNETTSETNAHFVASFEPELRDAHGAILPLTPAYRAERTRMSTSGWVGILMDPGEAAFRNFELRRLYGALPPGRYTLVVRHPHPVTGGSLVSNTLQLNIP